MAGSLSPAVSFGPINPRTALRGACMSSKICWQTDCGPDSQTNGQEERENRLHQPIAELLANRQAGAYRGPLQVILGANFGEDFICLWHHLCIRRLPGPSPSFLPCSSPDLAWDSQASERKTCQKPARSQSENQIARIFRINPD